MRPLGSCSSSVPYWSMLKDTGWARGCSIIAQSRRLPLILGSKRDADANYLDTCRVKRNTVEYDRIGATSDGEVLELIEFVEELRVDVLGWLKKNHPELLAS